MDLETFPGGNCLMSEHNGPKLQLSRQFASWGLALTLSGIFPAGVGSSFQRSAQGAPSQVTAVTPAWSPSKLSAPFLRDPVWVYNNWSAYDELSDNIPLTEELAMRELNEILRLRKLGVHFDYYMMDA